jgi:hypothetical protein
VSLLFSWYLGNFANYNATYGALGAVVGLMMWMWLSTIVVLVGAEFNSEIEHQTRARLEGNRRPRDMRDRRGRHRSFQNESGKPTGDRWHLCKDASGRMFVPFGLLYSSLVRISFMSTDEGEY